MNLHKAFASAACHISSPPQSPHLSLDGSASCNHGSHKNNLISVLIHCKVPFPGWRGRIWHLRLGIWLDDSFYCLKGVTETWNCAEKEFFPPFAPALHHLAGVLLHCGVSLCPQGSLPSSPIWKQNVFLFSLFSFPRTRSKMIRTPNGFIAKDPKIQHANEGNI